jgi:T6SS, Phospholipase effector Tle1-like, catalytic domain
MAKRLIVCFDGTWNSPDNGHATNVVKIMGAVAPVDRHGVPQITFYDAGIGADSGRIDRLLDGLTGRGLEQNVRDGYRFLAHNWLPGDEIFVFGFSRGAFTARSLCGFVDLCGLLPKSGMERLPEAWELYRTPKQRRDAAALAEVVRGASREVRIKCLGVWDTVGALGVPLQPWQLVNRKHRFHNAELSGLVECAFHALAIDEKRGPFGPVLWQKKRGQELAQVVEQVWFPGAHSDIGGGGPETAISDLALNWMIRRVQAHSDLAFDETWLEQRLAPQPLGPIRESRSALYASSRLYPYQRLLGQTAVRGSRLRRLLTRLLARDWRTNRPGAGCEFVNEMIHWSAVERLGRLAPENGRLRRYAPENLKVALERRMLIADERLVQAGRRAGRGTAPLPAAAAAGEPASSPEGRAAARPGGLQGTASPAGQANLTRAGVVVARGSGDAELDQLDAATVGIDLHH